MNMGKRYSQALDFIDLTCSHCSKIFKRSKRQLRLTDYWGYKGYFCSHKCITDSRKQDYTLVHCAWCNKEFLRRPDQVLKYKNSFCTRSCSAKHTMLHRSPIANRSKLEHYIEANLTLKYPGLCLFNDRKTIKLELDIYIPTLSLGIELNGPVHYMPIYTPEKLEYAQNNDARKVLLCIENKIQLYIIDTSQMKYAKEKNMKIYLDQVIEIIDRHLSFSALAPARQEHNAPH